MGCADHHSKQTTDAIIVPVRDRANKEPAFALKFRCQTGTFRMQHKSSKQLYAYWDLVRAGRFAPNRFEIEPVQLSDILPDVFILECADPATYRFRLAGTRICTVLGHELRGLNLLDYWTGNDHEAVQNLLHNVAKDGAGALIEFECANAAGEQLNFELLVLPLVHTDNAVTRMLGSITASEMPYWAGSSELKQMKLVSFELIWPRMSKPDSHDEQKEPVILAQVQKQQAKTDARKRFRVLDGGLAHRSE